jgi:purine-binding chemotaxis protein CheW
VVDGIGDIVCIEDNEIEPPPANVGGVEAQFISGVAKLPQGLLILLDMQRILASGI